MSRDLVSKWCLISHSSRVKTKKGKTVNTSAVILLVAPMIQNF